MPIGRLQNEADLLRWFERMLDAPDIVARLRQRVGQGTEGGGGEPDPHASTHQPGGSDPMAVNAAAGTGSLRSLGSGSLEAAAGDHGHATLPSSGEKDALAGTSGSPGGANPYVTDADARNTNARTPTAHTHPQSDVTNLVSDLAAKADDADLTAHEGATASVHGIADTSDLIVEGDARLTDSRDPNAHATTHQPGGSDAMAVNAAAGTGSLRSLGTGSTHAAAGNDSRFPTSGQKDALAGTSGTPSNSNRYVTNADSRLPSSGEKAALAGTDGTPSTGNRYVTDSDPRLDAGAGTPEDVRQVGTSGNPSFNTGWGHIGGANALAGFYKDPFGRVHLQGRVSRSSGSQTRIFTLPSGYRPVGTVVFASDASGAYGRTFVTSTGEVHKDIGSMTQHALDTVSFRAA